MFSKPEKMRFSIIQYRNTGETIGNIRLNREKGLELRRYQNTIFICYSPVKNTENRKRVNIIEMAAIRLM